MLKKRKEQEDNKLAPESAVPENNAEGKAAAKKRKKITVGSVISGAITAALVLFICFLAYALFSGRGGNGIKIGSYKLLTVITGSMHPSINPGDMVVVKNVEPSKISVGDIVTFTKGEEIYVSHRVVSILNGGTALVTKGDLNNVPDDPIYWNQVVGKVVFTVPMFGKVVSFVSTPLAVASIALMFVVYVVIEALIKETKAGKKKKAEERPEEKPEEEEPSEGDASSGEGEIPLSEEDASPPESDN